nr:acyl-CoA carboxylase subunit beta [uncultured Cellulosilyticum sp.]
MNYTYDMEKQHSKGKLHAIERIQLVLDKGSFYEIGSQVSNNPPVITDNISELPYDGVITGYGTISGKRVFIYAQDATVQGGTLGIRHGKKIAHVIKMAIKRRCPVIGINDSGGARLQECVNSMAGYGEIFYYNTLASGYIPQISIIAGPCAGGAAYSPGITDFIFTIDGCSKMFITGPKVVKSVTGQDYSTETLGGANMHATYSGASHVKCSSEEECFQKVRQLIEMLPSSAENKEIQEKKYTYEKKYFSKIDTILPSQAKKTYDVRKVIEEICDKDSFFEIQAQFAPNIVVGFAKLCGIVVGFIANQPLYMGGVLDCNASDKGARFVRYCDAYNIPLITLVDTPGFMPGLDQERNGIIRHGAKMLYAFSESTNVKVTVILRKGYGGAYIAMGSKHLGVDYVYTWPNAEIAVMGAEGVVPVIYSRQINSLKGEEKEKFIEEKMNKYKTEQLNAAQALAEGYVDEMITPMETRKRLYNDIVSSLDKNEFTSISKKHGCMPL